MPNEDNKILEYNHGEKSMKAPFIIYADLESLLEKMSTCYGSPEKSSTTKINKHTPSVIHYLWTAHLMKQKICLIVIEIKIAKS